MGIVLFARCQGTFLRMRQFYYQFYLFHLVLKCHWSSLLKQIKVCISLTQNAQMIALSKQYNKIELICNGWWLWVIQASLLGEGGIILPLLLLKIWQSKDNVVLYKKKRLRFVIYVSGTEKFTCFNRDFHIFIRFVYINF